MAKDDPKTWMTTGEVARWLQVTVTTVNRWIVAGKLPHIRTPGGRYRVPRDEFLALVQNGQVPAVPVRPALRILVVDDEEDNREIVRSFIEAMDGLSAQIEVAADGLEAADKIPDFAPHLLFVDLMMPRMTGFQLAGFVRGHPKTRGARIVIVTGFGDSANLQAAEKCGANTVLHKPYRAQVLQELVREAARELLPASLAMAAMTGHRPP